jgi:hypothetical protein
MASNLGNLHQRHAKNASRRNPLLWVLHFSLLFQKPDAESIRIETLGGGKGVGSKLCFAVVQWDSTAHNLSLLTLLLNLVFITSCHSSLLGR